MGYLFTFYGINYQQLLNDYLLKYTIMKTKLLHKVVTAICGLVLSTSVFAQGGSVSGTVNYHGDPTLPLSDVYVGLIDSNGNLFGVDTTDYLGNYAFLGVPNGTYEISFATDLDAGGIGIQDAHLILLNIFGLYTFNTIEFLAADVDADGEITMNDFFTIVVGWFINGYPFPAGDWVFEETTVIVGGGNRDGASTSGSSSGDVDGSWLPGSRSIPYLDVNYESYAVNDPNVEIPISMDYNGDLGGFYLALDYPEDLIEITDVKSELQELNYKVFENKVKVSWMDTERSELTQMGENYITICGVLKNSKKEVRLGIDPASHVIDSKGQGIENITYTLSSPLLNTSKLSLNIETFYPNPAINTVNLSAELPEKGILNIQLFDLTGKLIRNMEAKSVSGYVNEVINVSDLYEGMYLYKISFNSKNFHLDTNDLLLIKR